MEKGLEISDVEKGSEILDVDKVLKFQMWKKVLKFQMNLHSLLNSSWPLTNCVLCLFLFLVLLDFRKIFMLLKIRKLPKT